MTITFFAVGDGDCICLEWREGVAKKIGIIDCIHPSQRPTNPLVERLSAARYTHIEFVLLTHPHRDHYSGLQAIFEYCEEHSITIGRFLHTTPDPNSYIKALLGITDQRLLNALYSTILRLNKSSIIGNRHCVDNFSRSLPLGNISMDFLSPSEMERDQYRKSTHSEEEGRVFLKGGDANLTCAIVLLRAKDKSVLLTSDAVKYSIHRIRKSLGPPSLFAVQVPHHGSKYNHVPIFWRSLNRTKMCTAVISASGRNNHPSGEVLNDLERLGYSIARTDLMESDFLPLDMISNRTSRSAPSKDVVISL